MHIPPDLLSVDLLSVVDKSFFAAIPLLENALLWAQKAAAKPPAQAESPIPWWAPMLLIGVFAYFLLIRPEQRKRASAKSMLADLKKNDRIVTIGGIIGTIVNHTKDSEEVTIRLDENSNAKMRILRSAISRVVSDGDSAAENDKSD